MTDAQNVNSHHHVHGRKHCQVQVKLPLRPHHRMPRTPDKKRTCQFHAMMTMKHATKTLMQRRNKAPHDGSKRAEFKMTARNRLCIPDSAWKDVDRRSVHCRRPDNDAHAGGHHTLQISPPSPALHTACHHITHVHTCVRKMRNVSAHSAVDMFSRPSSHRQRENQERRRAQRKVQNVEAQRNSHPRILVWFKI